ncbi:Imm26 family immunity protein [Phytohabitans houttuyneae]|uniref:Uncharacterized protein n=1 Tax=Phytohabitans houttuyneae TaxID=1076126 RepID=A0A6V8KA43_9ACTN|nr:Imm26 family immunity protein [Phytohabitans houttuyneae]GFJ82093.1 hypothetical protein Phou_062730 [Phytohabitans houttuyneae]
MARDDEIALDRLTKRQKRPETGDVFRIRLANADYYFGLVLDGDMKVGPLAPGSIAVVVFSGGSASGEPGELDELPDRPLLMPPAIVNQRPWTLGYAEKIGTTDRRPGISLKFVDRGRGKVFDMYGKEVVAVPDDLTGVWGVGNEHTLADKIMASVGNARSYGNRVNPESEREGG